MSIMEKEEKNSRETGDKDDLAECEKNGSEHTRTDGQPTDFRKRFPFFDPRPQHRPSSRSQEGVCGQSC